jgi:hypothetical protein
MFTAEFMDLAGTLVERVVLGMLSDPFEADLRARLYSRRSRPNIPAWLAIVY